MDYPFLQTPIALVLLSTAVLILASAPVGAEIYKWVDENGVVTYSAKKPPNKAVPVQTVDTPSAPASADDAEEEFDAINASQQKAAEEEAKAEKERLEEEKITAQRRSRCTSAMKRVASMQRPRVNAVAEDGTRTRMPEEWRQQQLAEAQKVVEEACSDGA